MRTEFIKEKFKMTIKKREFKSIYKSFSLCLIFIVIGEVLFGQSKIYSLNDTLDQVIIERTDLYYNDCYYFIYKSGVVSEVSNPFLFGVVGYTEYLMVLDNDLRFVDSVKLDSVPGYYLSAYFMLAYNDTIYIAGQAIKPDTSDIQFFLSAYSNSLDLLFTRLYGDTTQIELLSDFLVNNNGNIVLSGKIPSFNNWWLDHILLYKCNRNGEVYQIVNDTSWHLRNVKILQFEGTNNYHFISYSNGIYFTDSVFNQIGWERPGYFDWFLPYYNTSWYNDSSYFHIGMAVQVYAKNSNSNDIEYSEDITYYLLNSNEKPCDSGFIKLEETMDAPGGAQYREPNLYYGGIQNVDYSSGSFTQVLNNVIVRSFNYNEELINWDFTFGGDANYEMTGLLVTENNETIVFINVYDWIDNPRYERDIVILKVDSNGVIVGSNKLINRGLFINVYPNPGKDQLMIHSSIDCGDISIINMAGKSYFEESFINGQLSINTSFLRKGIYIIHLEDNKNEIRQNVKWIKH